MFAGYMGWGLANINTDTDASGSVQCELLCLLHIKIFSHQGCEAADLTYQQEYRPPARYFGSCLPPLPHISLTLYDVIHGGFDGKDLLCFMLSMCAPPWLMPGTE